MPVSLMRKREARESEREREREKARDREGAVINSAASPPVSRVRECRSNSIRSGEGENTTVSKTYHKVHTDLAL